MALTLALAACCSMAVRAADPPQKPKAKAPVFGQPSWAPTADAFGTGKNDGKGSPDVLPRIPREVQQRLLTARKAIEQRKYSLAAAELQALLGGEIEDGFLPAAEGEATQQTARREAWRLLGLMPAEGRQWYEVQFGRQSQELLADAIAKCDRAALTRVSGCYFHTSAGYQATMLLAYDRLDHGQPLEAVVWLRRISESPAAAEVCDPDCSLLLAACWMMAENADRAGDVLRKLHERRPAARFRIGNREFTASGDNAEALRWLAKMTDGMRSKPADIGADWTLFRGNAARNADAAWNGNLGEALWAAKTVERSSDRALLRAAYKEFLHNDIVLLPAANPLVVGDTLLMRRPWQLAAVDAKSGRHVWEFPWKKETPAPRQPANPGLPMFGLFGDDGPRPNPNAELRQRVFDDAAYGQLSSDGRRVFLLDKLDATGTTQVVRMAGGAVLPLGVGPNRPVQPNRLVALDLKREGAVAWTVGGQTGEDEPKLAGMFFLGVPLPDPRQLYVLAECKGEIFLHALHAATGRVEWSRVIACPGEAVAQEPLRRLVGASLSLADDVLVCPTNAGAVVAVDATAHSLLWGYEYPRSERFQPQPVPRQPMNLLQGALKNELEVCNCWIDSCATIADGYVLLAPPDSDLLFCLDLFTGQEIWSARRGDNLFVAGIHRGKAILVGKREVTALWLADRKPAWPKPVALPDKGMPSGRGLACGDSYYLPTTAKQLLRINLDAGRIEAIVETKEALGNLVGLPDRLISQTAEGVDVFGTEK